MRTKIKRCIILLAAVFGMLTPTRGAFAESVDVSTLSDLQGYFSTGGEVRLTEDITISDNVFVTANLTLDLNGHTLNMTDKTIVAHEALLVVEDNSEGQQGKITSTASFVVQVGTSESEGSFTLNSGTIEGQEYYGVRNYGRTTINGGTITALDYVLYNENVTVMNGGLITTSGLALGNYAEGASFMMNGGKIETLGDDIAVSIARPNATFVMNDGVIEALYNNGSGGGGSAIAAFKYTEVTINDGSVSAYSNAVTSNGSASGNSEGTNAKFNVNGGTITSLGGAGIYAPQVAGVTTITGGTIKGQTGIEVRAGHLYVRGGTIISEGEYNVTAGSSGLAVTGAGISVTQHGTAQPIVVEITGGEISGEYPIAKENPLNYDPSIFGQVVIDIKGGKFSGDDLDDVTNNIPRGYTEVETDDDDSIRVVPTNSAGLYLTADMGDSINISGMGNSISTDYSEINVLSNCNAGYDVIMSVSIEDNNLYYDGDDTSEDSFAPIQGSSALSAASNSWGYFLTDNLSYTPTGSDLFSGVPLRSSPVLLKNASSTASQSDINDTFRVYFGVNAGPRLTAGSYKMAEDSSTGRNGTIMYQITASPNCTTLPTEVTFNENLDGNGAEGTDDSLVKIPTSSENILRTDSGTGVTTLVLSDKVPLRNDFAFVEWNTSPSGAGTSYHPNQVLTVGSGEGEISGEITLYAIWEAGCAGATICFDDNGADAGSVSDVTAINGTSVTIPVANISRTGYGFAGWNTKADGSGTNYGPEQNIIMPSSGGLMLYANWVASSGTLQRWAGASSMNVGDVIALTDERDGQVYTVAKLADGNVWTVENLRLDPGSVNFSTLNTNNPTAAFIDEAKHAASSTTLCNGNNAACINKISYNANNLDDTLTQSPTNNDNSSSWYNYGVYYNWYTATAGNGTYEMKTGSAAGDICPAGWHLPTGNNGEFVALNTAVSGSMNKDVALRNYPNNFLRSGDYNASAGTGHGIQGRFWSATASESAKAYRFGYDANSVTPNNTYNKWDAFSVRCVYDGNRIPITDTTISFDEHVDSVIITNATYGNQTITTSGTSVVLVDNETYTITATFESGYTINAWTIDANGQIGANNAVSTTYTVAGGNATLAVSSKVATQTTYTLNYDTGISTDTIPSETETSYNASYTFNVTSFVPVAFGSTLIGWSETSGSTMAEYVAGDPVTITNADPDNVSAVSKTLYAVYLEDTCPAGNICYFGNGADGGTMSNQSASSNASTVLIASNFSRTGYGFAGWVTSENATPYGPNATITTPDLTDAGLKLYAKWIESEGDLQTWNQCSTLAVGSVTALTDTRDNNVYTVAKLQDNNCWMIENLRLDPSAVTITNQNTNSPANGFAAAAEASAPAKSLCTSDGTDCEDKLQYNLNNMNRSLTQSYNGTGNASAWYSYGAYYNWFTATAGNGTYSTTSGDVTGDICPAGWRLPTGNTNGEYNAFNTAINNGATNNDVKWRNYPNNFLYSGEYNGSSRKNGYSQARIWTATANSAAQAYRIGLGSGTVTAKDRAYNKWDAFTVRCIYNNNN